MAKFRLAPLLKLRKYREQVRKRDLAAALAREQRQKDAVVRLAGLQQEQLQLFRRQQQTGRLDMQAVVAQKQYLGLLGREIGFGLRDVARAEHETGRRRGKVAEAMKDRKALDVLQERFAEGLRAGQRRAETSELDEAGLRIARDGHLLAGPGGRT